MVTHPEEVTRLAALLNDAQIRPEEVALGHDLTIPAARLYAAGVRVQPEPQAGGLDVERLAFALWKVDQGNDFEVVADALLMANEVAREYAALQPITEAATESEPGGSEPGADVVAALRVEAGEMDRAMDLLEEHRDNDAIEWALASWRLRVRRAVDAVLRAATPAHDCACNCHDDYFTEPGSEPEDAGDRRLPA